LSKYKDCARKLAKRILRENKKGRSWRVIAREDYPTVKAGTLNRFAKEKGNYIPTDESILIALGLKKPRKKRSILTKWIQETDDALQWFNDQREKIKGMSKKMRESIAESRKG